MDKNEYFYGDLLTFDGMHKMIDIINAKLPEEEKINLITTNRKTDKESLINEIANSSERYKKNIIAYTEIVKGNLVLEHADPLITSKRRVPGGNVIDMYFLYRPAYTTNYFIEDLKYSAKRINIKIFNQIENDKTIRPQADFESCFSLAVATLKNMTNKEFEKNIKNNASPVYIPTSLVKYAQSTNFLNQISSEDWKSKKIKNKEIGKIITVKQYREKKKEQGTGKSEKLSGFSKRVLSLKDEEEYKLGDLSSHESVSSSGSSSLAKRSRSRDRGRQKEKGSSSERSLNNHSRSFSPS